ncbi:MAG: 4-hydroxy-tetrahydrodipicolinate synthase [Methanomassiliicoccales archaeon]
MSKKFRLQGVYPALVTPFDKKEDINEDALRSLVRNIFDHVDGFVPCGTTGEFEYMSYDERKRVFDICIDEVNGKKPVIAGTGDPCTRNVIELTKYAQDAGADACLVVAPYFLRPSDKGIFEHFYRLSRAVDIPIILYNIPQTTGGYLPRRVIEDLADIDNIVGLKDSSGNLTYTMEVLEKTKGKIDIVVGHDEVVLPALAGGCSGMILASAQVYPDVWQRVFRAIKEGNLIKGREEQLKVQKLSRIFCRYGGPVPIKIALKYMGIDMGKTRGPLKEGGVILHEDREEIRLELEKIGKVPVSQPPIETPEIPLEKRFEDIGITPADIVNDGVLIGSASAGSGINKVRIDLVIGKKDGVVGVSFASQLVYLRRGYEALPAILEPNLSAKPSCLIVPTVELKNLRQANIMYGPAQAGIAKAIADKVEAAVIPRVMIDTHVMLAKAFVHPNALERDILYKNFYEATMEAIDMAFRKGVL